MIPRKAAELFAMLIGLPIVVIGLGAYLACLRWLFMFGWRLVP
jgi:hypothetical protein